MQPDELRAFVPTASTRAPALAAVLLLVGGLGCVAETPVARNLVLVSLDTVSALHTSTYGYARETTPRLDALARDGAVFERTYTPQLWTLTAHASLLTGVDPAVHGAGRRESLSAGVDTLAESLRQRGFRTYALIDNIIWLQAQFGFDRGFDRFASSRIQASGHEPALRQILQEEVRAASRDPSRRFFLFVHHFDPHSDAGTPVPYASPEPWQSHFLEGPLEWERSGDTSLLEELAHSGATQRDREVVTALYDASLLHTDEVRLGFLVDILEELGLAETTLLVVVSDHGEELFEHGGTLHVRPYEEVARVPFVMRGPGVPAGVRVEQLASLVDVLPTTLSLLGLASPDGVQGRDLSPLLHRGRSEDRTVFVDGIFGARPPYLAQTKSAAIAARNGELFSLVNRLDVSGESQRRFTIGERAELYALGSDAAQQRDVAAEHEDVRVELEGRMLDWYEANESERLRRGAHSDVNVRLEKSARKQLRLLGYVDDAEEP